MSKYFRVFDFTKIKYCTVEYNNFNFLNDEINMYSIICRFDYRRQYNFRILNRDIKIQIHFFLVM